MKKSLIIFTVLVLMFSFSACSSSEESVKDEVQNEKVNLTVDYSFSGIENGYDYQVKLYVIVDGEKIGETTPHLQSEPMKADFQIDKGNHTVKLLVMVNYNGNWEEHLKSKDYAIDAMYLTEMDFNTDQTIKLLFDLDKGAIREYN